MNYKTGESHWVIDSGCTQHMTGDPRMFTSLDEEVDGQERITFGDNSKGLSGDRTPRVMIRRATSASGPRKPVCHLLSIGRTGPFSCRQAEPRQINSREVPERQNHDRTCLFTHDLTLPSVRSTLPPRAKSSSLKSAYISPDQT